MTRREAVTEALDSYVTAGLIQAAERIEPAAWRVSLIGAPDVYLDSLPVGEIVCAVLASASRAISRKERAAALAAHRQDDKTAPGGDKRI